MFAQLKRLLIVLAVLTTVRSAPAYSLLGIYDVWQTADIGYQLVSYDDIGGPMNQFFGEDYRWNVKTIYYDYDISFLDYFGAQGTNAIEAAIAVLNGISAASTITDLDIYPLNTKRVNHQASALGLLDLKSYTLSVLLEQMGLANPERWVWCLRGRTVLTPSGTNYTVIKRNYDPVTRDISSYVNGVLYTYVIQEFLNPNYADAVEVLVDPYQRPTSVAGSGGVFIGEYFTGLTRDDMGGWKRLYENSANTIQKRVELLPDGTTLQALGAGSPWLPVGDTNAPVITNTAVTQAIRTGVDKIEFKRGNYDPYLGTFVVPLTNKWDDAYQSNIYAAVVVQKVERELTQPDLLFVAADLGLDFDGFPLTFTRTDTAGWVNNDAVNGTTTLAGPGTIAGPIILTYGALGPYYLNYDPYLLEETLPASVWGSFDGTTNAPVVFPTWANTLDTLKMQVIYGSSPWTIANSNSDTNSATVDNTGGSGTQR